MKLPDRLIGKWLLRHPLLNAWLDRYLEMFATRALRIFLISNGTWGIAYHLGWNLLSHFFFWITMIFMPTWILLSVIWFLKREIGRDMVHILRDKEHAHAHP